MKGMTQERKALMDKEAFRLYPTFVQDREIFRRGFEYADNNPDEKMIAKYLYEKKGYPIDLNGNLPSFDETMKDAEKYLKYKQDKLIEKACAWLSQQEELVGISFEKDFYERFKKYMEDK